jgi:hypothetical protein
MAKEGTAISYVEAERPPTSEEISMWEKAEKIAKRVNLLSYIVKMQWLNIKLTHTFAKSASIELGEPDLPDYADRMFSVLNKIEPLKDAMCKVNQLELGIKISSSGNDLDIVKPQDTSFGWVIPVIGVSLIVAGVIGLWKELSDDLEEITQKYNGVLKKADALICKNPNDKICKDWEKSKKENNYYKRESIIDSVKSALVSFGGAAKKGLGWGVALLLPVLALLYLPRRR